MACPAAATCLRIPGSYVACLPIGKKIALVQCAASAASTAGVFLGHGPSSKVSTTSPSRKKSWLLKCSKPKPGPPVVSISTTRATPSAFGRLAQPPCAIEAAAGAAPTVPVVRGRVLSVLCAWTGSIRPAPSNSVVTKVAVIRITNLYRQSSVEGRTAGRGRYATIAASGKVLIKLSANGDVDASDKRFVSPRRCARNYPVTAA